MERLLGVLKARFHILPREIRSWELDDVVSIAETCIILHSLIVRMQQNGYFLEEAGGENLITEFLNKEVQEAKEAAVEYE